MPEVSDSWLERLLMRFEPALEAEFEVYAGMRRFNTSHIGWCVLLAVMSGAALMKAGLMAQMGLNSLGWPIGLLALCGMGLYVSGVANAARWYVMFAEYLLMVIGLVLMGFEWALAPTLPVGRDLSVTLMLVVCVHTLVGLRVEQAVRANLLLVIAYTGALALGSASAATSLATIGILLLGSVTATFVGIRLDQESRRHFLERRALTATAVRDGLTGLYNRRRFDEHLNTVWQLAQRDGVPLALLLVDIDCFKRYNDWHGHQAGDACLKAVAGALSSSARRPLDFTARYGGEEFAVILYQASRSYVQEITAAIQANIAALAIPHADSVVSERVTVSIGVAHVAPSLHRSSRGFVQLADQALYQAKAEGRNRVISNESAYDSLKTGIFRVQRRAAS